MSFLTNFQACITRVGTEFKAIRTLISGTGTGNVSGLTNGETNIVAAINKNSADIIGNVIADTDGLNEGATNLYFTVARAVAAVIDDAATGTGTTWSSTKVNTEITAAVASALEGEDLSDLAAALTANTAADLGQLNLDSAQTLTAAQVTQGQANLNVYDKDELGAGLHTFDMVAAFNTAIA